MTSSLNALAALLVISPALAEPQQASSVEQIRVLRERADFDEAEAVTLRMLHSGGLDRKSLSQLHLELGIAHGARGAGVASQLEFRLALRLQPDLTLPSTVGPDIAGNLEAAQATLRERPAFDIFPTTFLDDAGDTLVRLSVVGSGDGLIHQIQLIAGDQETHAAFHEATPELTLRLPKTNCHSVTIRALDMYENEAWSRVLNEPTQCRERLHRERVIPRAALAINVPKPQSALSQRSPPTAVWLSAAASVNLLIATGILGVRALEARSDYNSVDENPRATMESKWELRERALQAGNLATLAGVLSASSVAMTAILYFSPSHRATSSNGAAGQREPVLFRF